MKLDGAKEYYDMPGSFARRLEVLVIVVVFPLP